MKIILRVVITIAMMLALAGCHNKAQRAVLIAADSLLNSAPDSALNLVETLDPADLSTDNQAYYALLKTAAEYKCYEPFTSDSLINIAVQYYKNRSQDQDLFARSLSYRAVVLAEMGLLAEAVHFLKKAEELTDQSDYFTLGWLNVRLGELYQMTYVDSDEHIEKYKKGVHYLSKVDPQSRFIRYAYSNIGKLYGPAAPDSAELYLNRAIEISTAHHDVKNLMLNKSLLAELYKT